MARGSSTSRGSRTSKTIDFSTSEGLASYARSVGLDKEVNKILGQTKYPKLNLLQRLGKTLGAFNPAEAILTGTEEGIGRGILKYGTGIAKGIASGITGRDYEGERRTFKDVAEELGVENKIAKFGIGFLGDVLLDPSTYFGGAIARGLGLGIKGATKVGLKGIARVNPESATKLIQAGENLKDAAGSLFKAGYKTQNGVVGDVMTFFGKRNAATKGLAESNLARLGTGILTPEQNSEVFTRLAGGKRLEYLLREGGKTAEEAGEAATKKVLEGATGKVRDTLISQMKRVKKFGQEVSGDEFYRSYFPFIKKDKVNKFLYETRGMQVGSEAYRKQFKNLLTDDELEKDIVKAFFNRETQVVSDRLTRDFLKNTMVKQYGKPLTEFADEATALKNGYKLLREKGTFGKEIGYIPQWDMKFIEDMFSPEFKSIDMIAKATGFDAITSLFKRSVTGLFAPFHIRNYVSGMIQNYEVLGAVALDPRVISSGQKLAYNAIKGNLDMSGKWGEALKPFMNRFGFSSFYKNEFDNALNAGQTLAQYEKAFSKGALKRTLTTAGMSAEATPFKIARSVGNYVEMQQKATAYIGALTLGKSTKEALALAEKAGFDYKMLTKFESQILRRIVPFYSFTRKNIELQLKTLGENPQRINQIMKLIENVGVSQTEEEKKNLPDYLKRTLGISLGKDTQTGLNRYVSSFGTPIEAFSQLFTGKTVMTVISQMNPLIKAPIEIGIGKDSFRQKDLKDVYDAKEYSDVPKIIKNLLDIKEVRRYKYKKVGDKLVPVSSYIQYVADPEKLLIARSLFTSRGFTYLDNIFDKDVSKFSKFVNLFTGIKAQQIDPDITKGIKEKENQRALEDLLLRYTSDIKKYQSVYKKK